MNNNKLKKNIIITLIVLIMCAILICIILININKENDFVLENSLSEEEIDSTTEELEELNLVESKKEYLRIRNSLNQYIIAINQTNPSYTLNASQNNNLMIKQNEINANIYNVLSKNYISTNSITMDNVINFVYPIKQTCFYIPINIYKKAETENVKTYAIYGVIEDVDYNPVMESYLILNIDKQNTTFSVEQLNNKQELSNYQVANINEIPIKSNNKYGNIGKIDEDLVKCYITTYKRLALGYPEIFYNEYLDEEYKNKKFGTLENFKYYITKNKEKIKSISVEKYSCTAQEDYIQYIAVDQNERKYIFNTTNAMEYTTILDSYTIDLPQFLEKYNSANDVEKVSYNIQKCIDAINDQDYSYMYNKLDSTFRENNYKTLEEFEKNIKNNLFEKNKLDESGFIRNEGYVYIYDINIMNNEKIEENKKIQIIMQLKEGTDFVMSYSFQ